MTGCKQRQDKSNTSMINGWDDDVQQIQIGENGHDQNYMERVEEGTEGTQKKRGISAKTLRSITFGLLVCSLALVLVHLSQEVVQNALLMVLAACMIVSFLFFPEGPIDGPFGAIWKIVNGASLFYLLGLVFLFFKSREESISLITTHIDPSLKLMDYEQVSYAQDCRIVNHDLPNPYQSLYHACFDLFALAHFLGWFFKTLICRDLKLILFASVSFQIIEYSLRNVLNNFKECWWDHVIVDIMGCNLLGIACAFFVIDRFGLDRYRWSLRSAPLQHSHWQNFCRFWSNWDVSTLETRAFGSLRPFLKMVMLLIAFQLNDLTLFFLKYIYHIPPGHFLCITRLWVVGLLTVNAVKEYYDFMRFRAKFRKPTILLFLSIVTMEILIIATQGHDQFHHAYIDPLGKFLLGSLVGIFILFFVKIGISDILRKLRGLRQRMAIKEQQQMKEYAKINSVTQPLEISKEE